MTTKRIRIALLPLLFALCLPVLVHAQQGPTDKKDDGWEQVNGQMIQPGESFEAKDLVATAYGFIWVMVAGFAVLVWRRVGAVEDELAALSRRVAEHAARKSVTK